VREMKKLVGSNGYLTYDQFTELMRKAYVVMFGLLLTVLIYRVLR
jgi:hypothetical protein